MLKKRLIPCLVLKDGIIVQSYGFDRYLPIGSPLIAVEFFINWDVDEIVLIDISATPNGTEPNYELITQLSKKCFIPLLIGGGIKTISHIQHVLRAGADKIIFNSAALEDPTFITKAAHTFGSQCIAISIDTKLIDNKHVVMGYNGKVNTGKDPVDWAKEVEAAGAGEIFLNSVDRDGARTGYDIEIINKVSSAVSIPVICCGGVGTMQHLAEGINLGKASAVSAANIFQFTEHSTIVGKESLRRATIETRIESDANYGNSIFSDSYRLNKQPDEYLESFALSEKVREIY